jgi:hypothetical protein
LFFCYLVIVCTCKRDLFFLIVVLHFEPICFILFRKIFLFNLLILPFPLFIHLFILLFYILSQRVGLHLSWWRDPTIGIEPNQNPQSGQELHSGLVLQHSAFVPDRPVVSVLWHGRDTCWHVTMGWPE